MATTAMVEFTSGGGRERHGDGRWNVTDTANAGEINCTNTAGERRRNLQRGYTLGAGVTLTETPAAGAAFAG
jgi:hypothetical protein